MTTVSLDVAQVRIAALTVELDIAQSDLRRLDNAGSDLDNDYRGHLSARIAAIQADLDMWRMLRTAQP
ncbi:hypothetical protein [Branchiibius sp. NY16-3462-2]|uniref:hypothetical protein n=1 Tax=Branchiibius sp. NY16-3462-2 TaxID=1807500 RepID=UPI000792C3BB|nr:hypothetical protein [Branchiibius sp. NY16-3462-2]KYH44800.1 hypothetical protein AZH51_12300 [Branchiibius sp. NY16-3462-2]